MFLSFLALVGAVGAVGVSPGQIKHLVTFGDSYTSTGWVGAGPNATAWPTYASRYAKVNLHPYAIAGATCSNLITSRPFPSVFENQIPDFLANKTRPNAKETVYSLWIGTNDLGSNALLTTKGNLPGRDGSTIVDTSACAVNWVQTLYDKGARNFIFHNIAPLQLLPSYSNTSYPDTYWSAAKNATEWNLFMSELVAAGNRISSLMLESLAPKLHGAHIALFDSYNFFRDIYDTPTRFLNGTAPTNVTGAIRSCVYPVGGGQGQCSEVQGTDRDSYLWYDELHPSEQANRLVAREISNIIKGGKSAWSKWLS